MMRGLYVSCQFGQSRVLAVTPGPFLSAQGSICKSGVALKLSLSATCTFENQIRSFSDFHIFIHTPGAAMIDKWHFLDKRKSTQRLLSII